MFNQYYTLILSTYMPSMIGNFKAYIESTYTPTIVDIKPEGSGLRMIEIQVRACNIVSGPMGGSEQRRRSGKPILLLEPDLRDHSSGGH
jgi:hypothetical protein